MSIRALSTLTESCHRTAISHAQLALLYSGTGPGPDIDQNAIYEPAISLSAFATELTNDSTRVTKAVFLLFLYESMLSIFILSVSIFLDVEI